MKSPSLANSLAVNKLVYKLTARSFSSAFSVTQTPCSFKRDSTLFLLLLMWVDVWKKSHVFVTLDFFFHISSSCNNISFLSLLSLSSSLSNPNVVFLVNARCIPSSLNILWHFLWKILSNVSLFQAISFSEKRSSDSTKPPTSIPLRPSVEIPVEHPSRQKSERHAPKMSAFTCSSISSKGQWCDCECVRCWIVADYKALLHSSLHKPLSNLADLLVWTSISWFQV